MISFNCNKTVAPTIGAWIKNVAQCMSMERITYTLKNPLRDVVFAEVKTCSVIYCITMLMSEKSIKTLLKRKKKTAGFGSNIENQTEQVVNDSVCSEALI